MRGYTPRLPGFVLAGLDGKLSKDALGCVALSENVPDENRRLLEAKPGITQAAAPCVVSIRLTEESGLPDSRLTPRRARMRASTTEPLRAVRRLTQSHHVPVQIQN